MSSSFIQLVPFQTRWRFFPYFFSIPLSTFFRGSRTNGLHFDPSLFAVSRTVTRDLSWPVVRTGTLFSRLNEYIEMITYILDSFMIHCLPSWRIKPDSRLVACVNLSEVLFLTNFAEVENEGDNLVGVVTRWLLTDCCRHSHSEIVAFHKLFQPSLARLYETWIIEVKRLTYLKAFVFNPKSLQGLMLNSCSRNLVLQFTLASNPVCQLIVDILLLKWTTRTR